MIKKPYDPFEGSELTNILVVAEMAKAKTFYIDMLGAELYREYGRTSLVIKFLDNWFLLVTSGAPTEDKPEISFKPPVDEKVVSHSFTIRVRNCQESYAILKERGVSFVTPPIKRGAETRCFFQDPDGHLFEISEYQESA